MQDVVVGHPRRGGRHDRQDRGGPVDSLHLALLVHRQHQGVLRQVQVQADHVADLVDELRVTRQLPGDCGDAELMTQNTSPTTPGLMWPGADQIDT